MNRDLINFLTFLLGLFMASASFAAVTVMPNIAEYSRQQVQNGSATGAYKTAQGQALFDSATRSYSGTGSFRVGGKALTVPAKISLSSGAASLVKASMRLNPWGIVGTLAAGWLLDQALSWDPSGGIWTKTDSGNRWRAYGTLDLFFTQEEAGVTSCINSGSGTFNSVRNGTDVWCNRNGYPVGQEMFSMPTSPTTVPPSNVPATDADWDVLSDPIPIVGSELPSAPYMSEGAPVDAPTYDFVPFSVSTGEPYKKPDGSTVQPMVTVSPNNTSVTYNTYNTTTINSSGQPVVDAPPSDENADELKDPCDANPDRLGCMGVGEVSDVPLDTEERSIPLIAPVTVGSGIAQCPAPLVASFMGQPVEFKWDMPCQAATWLKPLVLVFTWFAAGLIFIQGVRQ